MAIVVVNGTSAVINSNHVVTTPGISITAGNLIVVGTENFDADSLNDSIAPGSSSGSSSRVCRFANPNDDHQSTSSSPITMSNTLPTLMNVGSGEVVARLRGGLR